MVLKEEFYKPVVGSSNLFGVLLFNDLWWYSDAAPTMFSLKVPPLLQFDWVRNVKTVRHTGPRQGEGSKMGKIRIYGVISGGKR